MPAAAGLVVGFGVGEGVAVTVTVALASTVAVAVRGALRPAGPILERI
mgnify:CR=1